MAMLHLKSKASKRIERDIGGTSNEDTNPHRTLLEVSRFSAQTLQAKKRMSLARLADFKAQQASLVFVPNRTSCSPYATNHHHLITHLCSKIIPFANIIPLLHIPLFI